MVWFVLFETFSEPIVCRRVRYVGNMYYVVRPSRVTESLLEHVNRKFEAQWKILYKQITLQATLFVPIKSLEVNF